MLTPELTEKELKSQLIDKLDKLDKEQLLILHQLISRMIAEELVDAVTQDWQQGKINRDAIQKAVDQFRSRKPYDPAAP